MFNYFVVLPPLVDLNRTSFDQWRGLESFGTRKLVGRLHISMSSFRMDKIVASRHAQFPLRPHDGNLTLCILLHHWAHAPDFTCISKAASDTVNP